MDTPPSILVPVFGDVGEDGKIAERTHDAERKFNAEAIEFLIEDSLDRRVFVVISAAPEGHRQLSDLLDLGKCTFPADIANHVTQHATEQSRFFAKASVFGVNGVAVHVGECGGNGNRNGNQNDNRNGSPDGKRNATRMAIIILPINPG